MERQSITEGQKEVALRPEGLPWTLKTKMQASILAAYSHTRSAVWHAAASKASNLWEDDDFETCKINAYYVGDILP